MTTAAPLLESVPTDARRGHATRCVLALVAIVFVVFGRLIFSDFTWWDDQDTIHHNALLNPPTLQTLHYYWTRMPQGLYVPITYTVWAAIAKVAYVGVPDEFGVTLNPLLFHFASVFCHAGSVSIVFLILRRLFGGDRPALLGALLFAVHPVQVETIGWASGLKDLLCWLGASAIVLLYVRRAQAAAREARALWCSWEMPVAALILVLAILSKPTAMVTPAALLMLGGLVLGRGWRRSMTELAPLFAITLGGMAIARVAQTVAPSQHLPLWQRPLIVGDTLTFYLGKLIWPARLAADYARNPGVTMADPWVYAYWIVPAAIAVAAVALHRRLPWLALAFALFVIGVAPVSGVTAFQMQRLSTVTDHYLYFSMLGPAVALAWLATRWRGRWMTTTSAILLAAFASRSFVQTGVWHDSFSFFEGTIRANPRSTMARLNLVVCYLNKLEPEPAAAMRYASEAYEIAPDDMTVLWNYAVAKSAVNERDELDALFERAWVEAKNQGAPSSVLAELARAAYESLRGSRPYENIIRWCDRAIANNPNDGTARALLISTEQERAATQPSSTQPSATAPAATRRVTTAPAPAPASAPSR